MGGFDPQLAFPLVGNYAGLSTPPGAFGIIERPQPEAPSLSACTGKYHMSMVIMWMGKHM